MALANWHAAHQFCPGAAPTTPSRRGGSAAARDGTEHYPRTDPAVIMAVSTTTTGCSSAATRSGRGPFSVLAGFVEPGESFEAAVAARSRRRWASR